MDITISADKSHVEQAITAAMNAKDLWTGLGWEHRAAIFLKAADLLAGPYRYKMNAGNDARTIEGMAYQAEIDSACELIDFLRFNVHFMTEIYNDQPISSPGVWNRVEYRAREGFTFRSYSIQLYCDRRKPPHQYGADGKYCVVWKASNTQIYSASVFMEILIEAGLPAA